MKQRPCECVEPVVRKFPGMDEPNEYCERCDRWLRKTLNKAKRRAATENSRAPRAVEECGATHRPADGNDARDHD